MNVLQIARTTVHPPKKGGNHRIHGIVISFPSTGSEVERFCQGGLLTNHEGLEIQRTVEISDRYREYRPVNPFHDVPSLLQRLFGTPGYFTERWLDLSFPRSLRRRLEWADIVLVEGPFQVPPIKAEVSNTPVLYSSHNVESERITSRNRYLKKWYRSYIESVESRAIKCADGVICTSKSDERTFKEKFAPDCPVYLAPNGVYQDTIRDTTSVTRPDIRADLGVNEDVLVGIFVGSKYGPNVKAVKSLPSIARTVNESRDFEILVVGNVCDEVPELTSAEYVHSLGFVNEIEPLYDVADIGLNPITTGGGTNIKMIEYMGKGLPVITTPFGARGLGVEDDSEAVVAELDAFAEAITGSSTSTRERIGQKALEHVREHFTWECISATLHEDLKAAFRP